MLQFFLGTFNCFKTLHVLIAICSLMERYWRSLNGHLRWKNLCGVFECYVWLRPFDSFIPLNFPTELTITSLDLLFSCFLGHLNLPWLSSCIKYRAFLGRDVWSPFSCTFLFLIITFNVTGSVAIWGVLSKRDLFIHSCTHQNNVFFTDPQGYMSHGRAQRGGRREHWDGSSEGRWILGKMGSHWMVPTPHSVYLTLFGLGKTSWKNI